VIESTWLRDLLSWIVPAIFFIAIWMFVIRRVGQGGGLGGLMAIGKSRAKIYAMAASSCSPARVPMLSTICRRRRSSSSYCLITWSVMGQLQQGNSRSRRRVEILDDVFYTLYVISGGACARSNAVGMHPPLFPALALFVLARAPRISCR
jgi:hypothetical protein